MLTARRVNALPGGQWDLVFPTLTERPREVTTIDRQFRTFRRRHPEWAWVVPKTFRKTAATLVGEEFGLEIARAQLDHSSSATTARHYTAPPDLSRHAGCFRQVRNPNLTPRQQDGRLYLLQTIGLRLRCHGWLRGMCQIPNSLAGHRHAYCPATQARLLRMIVSQTGYGGI